MKFVEFEGWNKTFVAPSTMKDSCLDIPAQIGVGRVVTCFEFDEQEIAEIVRTKRIFATHVGEVVVPFYLATYNPLTDILSVTENLKGDRVYMILVKLWQGNHGVIERFTFIELDKEIIQSQDVAEREAHYGNAYYALCETMQAEMKDEKLYQKDMVVRLAIGVRELRSDDIEHLILSTDLTITLDFGAMKKEGTALTKKNIRQSLDLPAETKFYLIAQAQGFHKAYAWKQVSERFLQKEATEKDFQVVERGLVGELEKKKGRSLSFEPVTFWVARQRDLLPAPTTLDEFIERCDMVQLGERIQF